MIEINKGEQTKITNAFTKLIQNELRSKGLVDSGKLVKSISTKLITTNGNYSFKISGEDYFKYLDDEYNVTEDAMKSNDFNKIIEMLEDAIATSIEKEL